MAAVLAIVDVVLEEHLLHLEEGLAGQERIRASLMLRSYPGNLELIGHLLQPALEVLARLHQVFDVVDVGEVQLEQLEKLALRLRQVLVGQQVEEVAEVVARVEAQPLHVLHQDEAGDEHHFGEVNRVNAFLFVLLELNPRVLEQVHRVLGVHVLRQVELEVELPGGGSVLRQFAVLVEERQAKLDDLEQVDVTTQELVLVIRRRLELACIMKSRQNCFKRPKWRSKTYLSASRPRRETRYP